MQIDRAEIFFFIIINCMDNQFSRLELLIGADNVSKLAQKRVAVFGIGGVGGYVLEALVRSGVGEIDIIDNDAVDITNLNRQIISLHSNIGQYKVDVAQQRMLDINPNVKINKHRTFYTEKTADEFDFSQYDYIADAIDTVSGKLSLIEEAKRNDVKIICAMGAGNKLNPMMFEVADISKTSVCPLAKVIRGELKKRNIKDVKVVYSKECPIKQSADLRKSPASNSIVPAVVGLLMANEIINDLIKD